MEGIDRVGDGEDLCGNISGKAGGRISVWRLSFVSSHASFRFSSSTFFFYSSLVEHRYPFQLALFRFRL